MKRFIWLALIAIMVIAACQPETEAEPTTVPDDEPVATVVGTLATENGTSNTPDTPDGASTLHACPEGEEVAEPVVEEIVQIQSSDWVRGPADAAATIIEWGDFQCPFCAELAPLLLRLEDAYPADVRVVYRHLPLNQIHDKAILAAEAAEAAGAQGLFWEMHDLLFEMHPSWSEMSPDAFRVELDTYASTLDLDVQQFGADLDAGTYTQKVCESRDLALFIGITSTPFLLLNAEPWPQDLSYLAYNNLDGMLKYIATLPDLQYSAYPETVIDASKEYVATIETDQGLVVVDLFADIAPLAVNNFVFLANEGWYDGVPFHRVVADFVAQAGDPTGLGFGGVGYVYETEWSPDDVTYDSAGLLGVARTGEMDTNGAQFFITRSGIEQPQLDALNGGPYTIFGRVREGQDIVDGLTVRDPQSAAEIDPSIVIHISIEER